MKIPNYEEKIQSYLNINPNLTYDKFGVLLLIDSLYDHPPYDLDRFRDIYTHLDPKIVNNYTEGIIFLKIAQMQDSVINIKKRLNDYINIKFNYLSNPKSYEENMIKFRDFSGIITNFIDNVLLKAKLPDEIRYALREDTIVRNCNDFYEMLEIFKVSTNKRIKYEILRKIGLIVLLSRITRSFIIDELDCALSEIKKTFSTGLGLRKLDEEKIFLWVDHESRIMYEKELGIATQLHKEHTDKRLKRGLITYPLQEFVFKPFQTKFGKDIYHICARNKIKMEQDASYDSLLEKIIRKNLEYPTQVHDMIGLKIVVKNEEEIPEMINHLETFLGGSSTRKKEKNYLNRFGRRKISKFSSDEYYVWKAVYDIPLPHPSISQVEHMLNITKDNHQAQIELRERFEYFKARPRDFVLEVQLQDINSYLLSITKGSSSDHDLLKMNQIRTNSFHKLFPKEIYEQELINLKEVLLNNNLSSSYE